MGFLGAAAGGPVHEDDKVAVEALFFPTDVEDDLDGIAGDPPLAAEVHGVTGSHLEGDLTYAAPPYVPGLGVGTGFPVSTAMLDVRLVTPPLRYLCPSRLWRPSVACPVALRRPYERLGLGGLRQLHGRRG